MTDFSPVIIIGAPRSGTNMLRDVLVSLDGMGTWPCDEINYIWRHGNIRYPSDEIPAANATKNITQYIYKQFLSLSKKKSINTIIEKTCANCLRVPFVNKVIPNAKYIYIFRDGIDVVGSAKLRWTAKLNILYILNKVRFVPKIDLPYYALRYFWSRLYLIFSPDKRLAFWGPSLNNMQELLEKYSLNEVCALQWQACVDNAEKDLSDIAGENLITIQYENFVNNPKQELKRILTFLDQSQSKHAIEKAVENVSATSIGKGRSSLSTDEIKQLESLISDPLRRHGYL